MELYSRKKISCVSLAENGLGEDDRSKASEIYTRICEEIHSGEHHGDRFYFMGVVTTLPNPIDIAAHYSLDIGRFRDSFANNCMYPEYQNVFYYYPRNRDKTLFWFLLK